MIIRCVEIVNKYARCIFCAEFGVAEMWQFRDGETNGKKCEHQHGLCRECMGRARAIRRQ